MASLLRRLYTFFKKSRRATPFAKAPRARLWLEPLEPRFTPSGGGGNPPFVWNGAGPDNLASDAMNWVGDVAPTSSSDSITFNGTSSKPAEFDPAFLTTIAAVEIDSGYNSNITLDEGFTVTGTLTETGSTINGSSLTASAATVGGAAVWANAGGTIGTLTVTAGGQTLNAGTSVTLTTITISQGATLTNNGTITMQGNNTSVVSGPVGDGGTNSLVNNGLFQKTQSLSTDQMPVGVAFTNTGTVQVQTGIVAFNSSFNQTSRGRSTSW